MDKKIRIMQFRYKKRNAKERKYVKKGREGRQKEPLR